MQSSRNLSKQIPLREQIDFRTKLNNDRVVYVEALVAWTPRMNEIYKEIVTCQKDILFKEEPVCMSLLGESRTGKTTLAKQYLKRNQPYELNNCIVKTTNYPKGMPADITCIPVVFISVASPPSAGAILHDIAKSMGHPGFSQNMTNSDKFNQLRELMYRCKVELIIMDEIHHLIDPKSRVLMGDTSEWLKDFIIKIKIPVLIIGVPEAEKIFTNSQLNNRFLFRQKLLPFEYSIKEDRNAFRKVLQEIDNNLPLMIESGLAKNDTWERILLACDGYFAHCMTFIKRCAQVAINNGNESITYQIMNYVYEKYYSFINLCEGNPFDHNFKLEDFLEKALNRKRTPNIMQPATNNRSNPRKH